MDTSETSTLLSGVRQSAYEPSPKRSRNVWKPASFLSQNLWFCSLCPAFYLFSPARTSISRGGIHLPSPTWVERGGKETYQSQRYRTLKRFSNTCWATVVPYLVHKPPGAGRVPGYTTWASGVPWCSSGRGRSPHILGLARGHPEESPMAREYFSFIKEGERVPFLTKSLT